MRSIIILSVLISINFITFSQDCYKDYGTTAEMQAYMFLGDYESLLIALLEQVQKDDDKIKFWRYIEIGDCYKQLERYSEAITYYTKYIYHIDVDTIKVINPCIIFPIKALVGRAACKVMLMDFRGALKDAEIIIPIIDIAIENPDYRSDNFLDKKCDAYYTRGVSKLGLGIDKEGACNDLSIAGELGMVKAYEIIKEYCY
jgi:tetratricopeptide (TPR) repeat protein